MRAKSWRVFWTLVALLGALGVWLFSNGSVTLRGLPIEVLESLCEGRDLIPWRGGWDLTLLLSPLPLDPFLLITLVNTGLLLGAYLLLWAALYGVWKNPVSPTLCVCWLYFGGETSWVAASTPEQCAVVALKAAAVAMLVSARVPLLCGTVVFLSFAHPPTGVSMLLALTYMAYKRQDAYGPFVSMISVVGAGSLLPFLAGDYLIRPSLSGWSLWTILPLSALLFWKPIREARAGLYLTLVPAALISGTPEIATAVFLGDAALMLGSEGSQTKLAILAPTALLLSVWPGFLTVHETLQTTAEGVPPARLLTPFSLQRHTERLPLDEWRPHHPYPQLHPADLTVARRLTTPFRVLTLGRPEEDRALSLLLALYSRHRLTGWEDRRRLSASSLVCKELGENVLLGNQTVLFRKEGKARLESGPNVPKSFGPLNLRKLINLPFRVQKLSEKAGAGYAIKSLKGSEKLYFKDHPAVLVLPATPEAYTISSLRTPDNSREFVVNQIKLELVRLEGRDSLMLYNRGQTPFATSEVERVLTGSNGEGDPEGFGREFILFPEEGIPVTLPLSKDAPVRIETKDGVIHQVSML